MIVSSSPEREADFESAISSFRRPRKRRRAPAVRFWNGWSSPATPHPSPPPRKRCGEEPQVGEQFLDLAPLVEACAADEAVGDVAADERLLQGPRLGVGAVHHGEGAEGEGRRMLRPYSFGEPLHLLGDERRLLLLVVRLVDDDRAAGAVLRTG